MRIHIIQQESFVAPGAYAEWAKEHGYIIEYTQCWLGEKVPTDADGFDMLIVLGGPQSPATTKEECPYYDSEAEQALIKKAIESGKIVVGACLGAQLIGEALGAPYEHSPNREIGVIDIELTQAGKNDPFLGKLPEKMDCGVWHGDMPGLTADSEVLASSEGCPRQIVRYGKYVYGIQCHPEFNHRTLPFMIIESPGALKDAATMPYINTAEEIMEHSYVEMNERLKVFLDALTEDWEAA